jgi:hypothetical protein
MISAIRNSTNDGKKKQTDKWNTNPKKIKIKEKQV